MTNTNVLSQNPLLLASPNKHKAISFPDIRPEHFLPAIDQAIQEAKLKFEQIKSQSAPPTFENTLLALETLSEKIELISGVFYNLLSAETNESLQALAKEMGPRLSNFSSDISLDSKIFARVKTLFENRTQLGLNTEQSELLDKSYKEFVRNGALLSETQKNRLREIDETLSKLGPEFSDNVLKDTNSFEFWETDLNRLKGLPESALEAAALAAEEKGKKGQWLFTLQAPSLLPYLQYCENREGREKLHRAYNSRAFNTASDNQKNILELIRLRHERAQLLGFKNHAEFVLERRMAESPERVRSFLEPLLKSYKLAAEKDLKMLETFAKSKSFPSPIQPWDVGFLIEALKKEKFNFDEEELRPYFKLENVEAGAFEHARKLYGLNFKASSEYPVYHPDVRVFEVWENNDKDFVGLLYADFFPRAGKRSGAWMTNYLEQGLYQGKVTRPHVSVVCNFTKPTASKPSLLTFDEVRTLFHELGHALHSLLSKCTYRSLSGTNVYWDFVELPSQVFENWTQETESLRIFAKHYLRQEPIPDALVQKIKETSKFLSGWYGLRQSNLSTLDLAWHTVEPSQIRSVPEFELETLKNSTLIPPVQGTNVSCSFSHIFAGGYSAGYYSYKWAEVLDADAFEYFKERGLFDAEVAGKFKEHILSRGGTEHPMELYKRFRGREPDPKALLRRDGLAE